MGRPLALGFPFSSHRGVRENFFFLLATGLLLDDEKFIFAPSALPPSPKAMSPSAKERGNLVVFCNVCLPLLFSAIGSLGVLPLLPDQPTGDSPPLIPLTSVCPWCIFGNVK